MTDLRRHLVISSEKFDHAYKNPRLLLETAIAVPASAWMHLSTHRSHIAYSARVNTTSVVTLRGEFFEAGLFKITELSLTRAGEDDISMRLAYPHITVPRDTLSPADFPDALRSIHVLTHEEIDALGLPARQNPVSPLERIQMPIFEILAKALPKDYQPGPDDLMLVQHPEENERWFASIIPIQQNNLEYDLSAREDIVSHLPTIALITESLGYKSHYIIDAFSASVRLENLNPLEAMSAFNLFAEIRKRFTPAYQPKV